MAEQIGGPDHEFIERSTASPLRILDLINGGWQSLPFQPFREGVEISEIFAGSPAVAVLRYQPGASVPRHQHNGLEVVVLEGVQSDSMVTISWFSNLNPGTAHSVWSTDGCVVLVNEAVQFWREQSETRCCRFKFWIDVLHAAYEKGVSAQAIITEFTDGSQLSLIRYLYSFTRRDSCHRRS